MPESNIIEIPLSKIKLTKFLLFSILFVIGGTWMAVSNPQTGNPIFNNAVVKAFAAYSSIIMGLAGIYLFTKKLFDKWPALIISEEGLYDNASIFKLGFVPWRNVLRVYEQTIQASIASKQRFICITLSPPGNYLIKAGSAWKKRIMKANTDSFGLTLRISVSGLKAKHTDLLSLLKCYSEKYNTPDGN
jgi:hypothetical protein